MSLYPRPSKQGPVWYYRFVRQGTRYNERIGLVSRAVAKQVERRKMLEVEEGRWVSQARVIPTLAAFASEWMTEYSPGHAPGTLRRKRADLVAVLAGLGDRRLSELSDVVVAGFKRQRLQTVGAHEVNSELRTLKQMLALAVQWDVLARLPYSKLSSVKPETQPTRVLSAEEETRLLAACVPTLRAVVTFALQTGLRRYELMTLRWGDIDLDRRQVRVRGEIVKTRRGRVVPLNVTALGVLRSLAGIPHPDTHRKGPCDRQSSSTPSQFPVSPGAGTPQALQHIFLTYAGVPYRDLNSTFHKVALRVGLGDVTPHTLRHTCATRLIMAGVPQRVVAELLGHTRTSQTDRYTHPSPEHLRQAVALLDGMTTRLPTGGEQWPGNPLPAREHEAG